MVLLSKYGTDIPAERLSREMDKGDIYNEVESNRLSWL
jgi:hypothetical protein